MGIFSRLKRLEDDMFQRKTDEKLLEYGEKYDEVFGVDHIFCQGYYLHTLSRGKVAYLGEHFSKESLYERVCDCETEIRAELYDKIKTENELLKELVKKEEKQCD